MKSIEDFSLAVKLIESVCAFAFLVVIGVLTDVLLAVSTCWCEFDRIEKPVRFEAECSSATE
jgi:hypothetical protein